MTKAHAPRAKGGNHATTDLRGASRLAIDAVTGVTDIVEAMHRNIAGVAPIVGDAPGGRTRGITGLVYRSVRGVTRAVGFGLDTVLGQLAPLLGPTTASPRREAVLAALNGVLGDYLEATGNPLAIPMQLRVNGTAVSIETSALAAALPDAGGKLLILVHGLCMNDLQWQREGHDHGAHLAAHAGYTPLYLHYNTGRPIAANGADFATLLETLVAQWPVPVTELVVLGHSMGGLVARSACAEAKERQASWLSKLTSLIFLGTPHHGAPLERAGNWVDILLGISPYTAPFARLGTLRSAGIQDLRYGHLDAGPVSGRHAIVPLPQDVACFAIAATRQKAPGGRRDRLPGDGLVPVRSALGLHATPSRRLGIPAHHQQVFYDLNHFDLLSSIAVGTQLKQWLRPA